MDQYTQIYRHFNAADINNDGMISFQEAQNYLGNQAPAFMNQFDLNNDGRVSFGELAVGLVGGGGMGNQMMGMNPMMGGMGGMGGMF
ncbi:hypothetical protein SNEBB_004771 [Seison nebaliae]|nr:hypothetical protein SNEBB_004771 [Seison nebaliae]